MAKHDIEVGLITAKDLPELAEAGRVEAPAVGHSVQELHQAVRDALAEQWSLMGIIDTGKKAADGGKKLADAITDEAKKIDDAATKKEKAARDEAHKKINDDKAKKKQGKDANAEMGASAHAFARALSDLRA
jgi:hypothetical protein